MTNGGQYRSAAAAASIADILRAAAGARALSDGHSAAGRKMQAPPASGHEREARAFALNLHKDSRPARAPQTRTPNRPPSDRTQNRARPHLSAARAGPIWGPTSGPN